MNEPELELKNSAMEIRTTLDELDSILTVNEEKISELECCREIT